MAAGGILFWLLRRARQPVLFIALALILIPLADLPILLVKEAFDWQIVRTQVSLGANRPLLQPRGARDLVDVPGVARGTGESRAVLASEWVATAVAIAFVATGVVLANRNVDTLIAEPQTRVATAPRPGSRNARSRPERGVCAVGPDELQPETERYDAFGVPSSFHAVFAVPLVLLLLREQGRLRSRTRPSRRSIGTSPRKAPRS